MSLNKTNIKMTEEKAARNNMEQGNDSLTMDFVIKNIKLISPLKRCKINVHRKSMEKYANKKRLNVDAEVISKKMTEVDIRKNKRGSHRTQSPKEANSMERGNRRKRKSTETSNEVQNKVLKEDQNKVLNEDQNKVLNEDQNKVLKEDQNKVLKEEQNKALKEDQNKVLNEDQNKILKEDQSKVLKGGQKRATRRLSKQSQGTLETLEKESKKEVNPIRNRRSNRREIINEVKNEEKKKEEKKKAQQVKTETHEKKEISQNQVNTKRRSQPDTKKSPEQTKDSLPQENKSIRGKRTRSLDKQATPIASTRSKEKDSPNKTPPQADLNDVSKSSSQKKKNQNKVEKPAVNNKKSEEKKKRQIFIRLPFPSNAAKLERPLIPKKEYKEIAKNKSLNKLGKTYLKQKFGSRMFKCYVKLERYHDPNNPVPKKDKSNRKSVSFVDTVEVFGESSECFDKNRVKRPHRRASIAVSPDQIKEIASEIVTSPPNAKRKRSSLKNGAKLEQDKKQQGEEGKDASVDKMDKANEEKQKEETASSTTFSLIGELQSAEESQRHNSKEKENNALIEKNSRNLNESRDSEEFNDQSEDNINQQEDSITSEGSGTAKTKKVNEENANLSAEDEGLEQENVDLTEENFNQEEENVDLTEEDVNQEEENVDLTKEGVDQVEENIDLTNEDLQRERRSIDLTEEEDNDVAEDDIDLTKEDTNQMETNTDQAEEHVPKNSKDICEESRDGNEETTGSEENENVDKENVSEKIRSNNDDTSRESGQHDSSKDSIDGANGKRNSINMSKNLNRNNEGTERQENEESEDEFFDVSDTFEDKSQGSRPRVSNNKSKGQEEENIFDDFGNEQSNKNEEHEIANSGKSMLEHLELSGSEDDFVSNKISSSFDSNKKTSPQKTKFSLNTFFKPLNDKISSSHSPEKNGKKSVDDVSISGTELAIN